MESPALPGNPRQIASQLVMLLLRARPVSRFSPVLSVFGGSTCDGGKRAAWLLTACHCVGGWLIGSPEAWKQGHPPNRTAASSSLARVLALNDLRLKSPLSSLTHPAPS